MVFAIRSPLCGAIRAVREGWLQAAPQGSGWLESGCVSIALRGGVRGGGWTALAGFQRCMDMAVERGGWGETGPGNGKEALSRALRQEGDVEPIDTEQCPPLTSQCSSPR